MSLRAICRIVMAFLLAGLPLVAVVFNPAQVSAAPFERLNQQNITSQSAPRTPEPAAQELVYEAPKPPPDPVITVANQPAQCSAAPDGSGFKGLRGIVFERNLDPINGAEVRIYNADNGTLFASQVTSNSVTFGGDGAFAFNSIPGNLRFKLLFIPPTSAFTPGSPGTSFMIPQWYRDAPNFANAATLVFDNDCYVVNTVTGEQFSPPTNPLGLIRGDLDPPNSFAGRVFNRLPNPATHPYAAGSPISATVNIAIFTNTLFTSPFRTVNNNGEGNFTSRRQLGPVPNDPIGGLIPGDYYLRFTIDGYDTSYYRTGGGTETPALASPVTISASQTPCTDSSPAVPAYENCYYPLGNFFITQTLKANFTIAGTIINEAGTPVFTPVKVRVIDPNSGAVVGEDDSDTGNGNYSIPNLAPSTNYKLQFISQSSDAPLLTSQFWYNNSDPNATDPTLIGAFATDLPPEFYTQTTATAFQIPLSAQLTITKNMRLYAGATITGKVEGQNTPNVPEANAIVELYANTNDPNAPVLANASTGGDGLYTFTRKLRAGSYKMYIRTSASSLYSPGWYFNNTPINVTDTITGATPLVVPTNYGTSGTPVNRDILLPRGASLQGTVTPPNDLLPGGFANTTDGYTVTVQVTILRIEGSVATVVNSFNIAPGASPNASFTTPALRAGTYKLLFGATTPPDTAKPIVGGLRPAYYKAGSPTGTFSEADATSIVIDTGGNITPPGNKDIQLTRGARLNVTVRDNLNNFVANAQVIVYSGLTTNQLALLPTDSNGFVRFDFLPGITATVAIFPPGNLQPTYVLIPQTGVPGCATPIGDVCIITLNTGQEVSVSQTVTKSNLIVGNFATSGGPGVSNWSTTVITILKPKAGGGYTQVPVPPGAVTAGGAFQFQLETGITYRVKFTPPAPYLEEWYNDKFNPSQSQLTVDSSLTQPQNVGLVIFTFGSALRVRAFLASSGAPVVGGTVRVFTDRVESAQIITAGGATEEDGVFITPPLPPGTYFVSVNPNIVNFAEVFFVASYEITGAQGIVSQNGAYSEVPIGVSPPGKVNGTILVQTAVGPPRETRPYTDGVPTVVEAYNSFGALAATTTVSPANGTFVFDRLVEGQYKFKFKPNPNPNYNERWYAGQTGTQPTDFYGVDNQNAAVFVTVVPNTGPLSEGRITQTYILGVVPCEVINYNVTGVTRTSIRVQYIVTPSSACSGGGRVDYGLTSGVYPNQTSPVGPVGFTHDVTLTSLTANTTYFLSLKAINGGNPVVTSTEVIVTTAPDDKVWYFAVGESDADTTQVLHILNPGAVATSVTISYYPETGPVQTETFNVGAGNRIDRAGLANLGRHSIVVSGTNAIVVERTLYGTYAAAQGNVNGGYTIFGTPGLSKKSYFANLSNLPEDEQWVTVFNPTPVNKTVLINYLSNAGGSQFNQPPNPFIFLGPNQRFRFSVKSADRGANQSEPQAIAPNNSYGLYLLAFDDVGFVAEVENYRKNATTPTDKGFSGSAGVQTERTRWYFTESADDKIKENTYIFLNSTLTPTQVTVTYIRDNPAGTTTTENFVIPAGGRLEKVLPENAANGNQPIVGRNLGLTIIMEGNNPIVVQRNVKFRWRLDADSNGRFTESAVDFERRSRGWIFAGGDTRNDGGTNSITEMTYSLYNPAQTQVTVNITFYFYSGATQTVTSFKINGNSRVFLTPANNAPGFTGAGLGKDVVAVKFSAVENEIYAERLMYFSRGNIYGGNAIFGHPTDP